MAMRHHARALHTLLGFLLVFLVRIAAADAQLVEINPSSSTLATTDPDGASGGRVNGLARGDATTYYAASEWAGLYKSTDTGRHWVRLDAHLPTSTWDIKVSPADPNRLIATSFYDGKVASLAGINVSTDGGNTWTHPPSSMPPAAFCTEAARREEPSAFGVAFDPAQPANVYVATNCGLAISNNAGQTWRFVDPTPADPPDDIWDVYVHHGGVIDICGDDGHRRSTNGGTTWAPAAAAPLPSGRCSITSSPAEAHVIFAVAGTHVFESDDGGRNWNTEFTNRSPQGRVPFVATNARGGNAFDLWFGDVELWRATCTTPAPAQPGGNPRCPPSTAWAGPFTRNTGGHDDVGDLVFASPGGCPVLFSSDGGVFVNSTVTSPACHTPAWQQPVVTPHGLWLFGMGGARRPGMANDDLYLGAQDNGAFASVDDGHSWKNVDCCDTFETLGSPDRVLYTTCCFSVAPATRIYTRGPGMVGGGPLSKMPPGNLPGWRALDALDRFAAAGYVAVTTTGVFVTTNVTASPIVWRQLGTSTSPPGACGIRATEEATPTFIVQAGTCNGRTADALWRYTGTAATGTWRRITPPGNAGGFGPYAVDRHDGRHLIAAHLGPTGPAIVLSVDAGATWTANAALDALMTGGGKYRYQTRRGPIDFTDFGPYVQPTLLAVDPFDRNTIVAGSADAGVFLTRDHGASWSAVTDSAGNAANPILPRPSFAHFARTASAEILYVGTAGRGIWRTQLTLQPHPVVTTPQATQPGGRGRQGR
jgi:photosystem II stability/assembly factor-like uncharacterized protein